MTDPPSSVQGDDGTSIAVEPGPRDAYVMVHMGAAVNTLSTWRVRGEDELVYDVLRALTHDELVALSAALTREVGWLRNEKISPTDA
jgi:hypothetical protein